MKKTLALILVGAGILSACAGNPGRFLIHRGPVYGPLSGRTSGSNGERIYLTAFNERGEAIQYTGGPGMGGRMMGASLTCAACHGVDGRGGVHTMHMQVMDAPDIRYVTLSGEVGEHREGSHEDDHAHEGYSLENFRQAVVAGRHADGDPLSRDMPRWQLSEGDLEDLYGYLKSFP